MWEHTRLSTPRVEDGFCTDDNARALIAVSRAARKRTLTDLGETYLGFVLDARLADGRFHNRRAATGEWTDDVGSDDSQGRAWWGLGTVARLGSTPALRAASSDAFGTCASFESPHLRSNAYAALGAVQMLAAAPGHVAATALARGTSAIIADAAGSRIHWPEGRLTYDNARLPEALMASGVALGDRRLSVIGIRLLEWLVGVEMRGDHFSFVPTGGWATGEPRSRFDQQPLEASAMAEACHKAWSITGDDVWRERALLAVRWLVGTNDTGLVLYDETTGETSDGLMRASVNQNRGAESTLAGIALLQVGEAFRTATPEWN